MAPSVFVASGFTAQYPEGGGSLWVPLQYVRGLRDLGVDAWWLEVLWPHGDEARDRAYVATFLRTMTALGLGDRTVLLYAPRGSRDDVPDVMEHYGLTPEALRARARDGLLLNLAHSVPKPLRGDFARTVLFDIDPGAFQLWAREWDMGVGSHDVHLTIGQNLGGADSPVPLGDVTWHRTWPAVHLPSWPAQPPPAPDAAYTTVTQWWSGHYAFLDGDAYDCNKRSGFVPLLPLARRVSVPLELAANLHADEREDRALIAAAGWRLVDPAEVAGTPETFRRYVQASRGELSAAKPAYVKARPGWISDRTVCYLASGRPAVVEETGVSAHLPASSGLRFFRGADEAAEAIRAIEADPVAAGRAARRLAEEVFATRAVLPRLLRLVGA
ncbi:MAG: hypothetical protein KIT14_14075 [bacterium]|nr:hypothetical protein [bacterium]